MQEDKIGIVTVLYNSAPVLKDFFETLNIQTYKNFILYVVNNNSPDNSLELVNEYSKNVFFKTVVINSKENVGVAAGNNLGIKKALEDSCAYILLSNNDIVLTPITIENLFKKHNELKADLSVSKAYYYGTNKLWLGGGYFNKIRFTGMHIGINEEDSGQYDECKEITYAPTCFMLVNSSVFKEDLLMDEKYFVYFDDTDFVYRCIFLYHKKLFYIPDSSIQHKVSCSTGDESDFSIRYINRNWIYFARKFHKQFWLFYLECIMFHLTIRNFKLRNNRHKWNVMLDAYKEGLKYN